MSRILRRPMFRGGRVSSYGTGIASGLADGGMPPKRGLVTGPGGYAGWEDFLAGNYSVGMSAGKVPSSSRFKFKTGKQTYDEAIDKPWLSESLKLPVLTTDEAALETTGESDEVKFQPKSSEDIEEKISTSNWEDLVALEKFESQTKYDEDFLTGKFDSFVKGVKRRVGLATDDAFMTDVDLGMQLQPPVNPEDAAFWKIFKENPEQAYKYWKDNISTWGTKQEEQMKHAEEIGANVDYGIKKKEPPKSTINTSSIVDLDEKVLEIQNSDDAELSVEEIKEALGGDKARRRDLTDMALLASAKLLKPGATVRSGWSEFMEAEAAKGPSRTEVIDKEAATFMLKDKFQTKRDKAKIKLMRADTDYKLAAGKKVSIQEGILASTKDSNFSDKKLGAGIQYSTSDATGEKYKYKGTTDAAGLKAALNSGELKAGDTVIVKETIKVEGQPDQTIKKIIEIQVIDGKVQVVEIYRV